MAFDGTLRILEILINESYLPVACLTEYNLNEEVEMLNTTTRENNGWASSRPVTQSYNIDFSGIQINSIFIDANGEQISYDYLIGLKRSRALINWRIMSTSDNLLIDQGRGYINSLNESAEVDNFVSFSGNIIGFGQPSPFEFANTFTPANGAELSALEGQNSNLRVNFGFENIIKLISISGTVTNTTTNDVIQITSDNTTLQFIPLTNIDIDIDIDTPGIYEVQLNTLSVANAVNTAATNPQYNWSFRVVNGYSAAHYSPLHYVTI